VEGGCWHARSVTRGVDLQNRWWNVTGQFGDPCTLKPQRVPSFGAPAFTDPPAFQDDVLAPSLLQETAHREPGLAAPDDNDVLLLPHAQPPAEW
jgi:hypothetical protein